MASFVWMVLESQPLIGTVDILQCGIASNAQDKIVILHLWLVRLNLRFSLLGQ